MSRRTTWIIRGVTVTVICLGPIARAAWDTNDRATQGPERVDISATQSGPDTGAVARVADYLSRRNPAVDHLLPAGAGGTAFFTALHDHLGKEVAGVAFVGSATVGLSVDDAMVDGLEATELHERAHLLHAARRAEVDRLLSRLPPPAPAEYAAKNAGEHFAEMARQAWDLVVPSLEVCSVDGPGELLRQAEESVPGTAGFVVWYLRQRAMEGVDNRDALLTEAEALTVGWRAEWEAIFASLDGRRVDGHADRFAPWPGATVRQLIEARRADGRLARGWRRPVLMIGTLPSLAVLRLVGR